MRRVGGESAVLALTDGPEGPALLDTVPQAGRRQAPLPGRPEDPCRALAQGYVARLVEVHEDDVAEGAQAGEVAVAGDGAGGAGCPASGRAGRNGERGSAWAEGRASGRGGLRCR
ncbi:hypothetical protein Srubr_57060 [Streptomyces rubradiris]|uniref:Uncharacterized protein n=1 Tax=Streptomyces rubradiris TaxID=285531 RepID=A0ABQ3RJ90_STRRR|nr:hypothetical protein GCM10018792_28910 [Streptomyces rubradiris]GHI55860.1 hypothetical protein Srubr_57060 [Streptomyces rubradiris]